MWKDHVFIICLIFLGILSVSCITNNTSGQSNISTEVDSVINNAVDDIIGRIHKDKKIAFFNTSTEDPILTAYIIEEMAVLLFNKGGFTVVERENLESIDLEHNFQMSGVVSDEDIISIMEKSPAEIVVSCSIDGNNALRRLRIRALDVRTAEALSLNSYRIGYVQDSGIIASDSSRNIGNNLEIMFNRIKSNIDERSLVAVFNFVDLNGIVNELGIYLADELSNHFLNSGVVVLDRQSFSPYSANSILNSTIVLESEVIGIGEMLGAESVVYGVLNKIGDNIAVSVRLANTREGKIYSIGTFEVNDRRYLNMYYQ
jgi:TolB-like protein